MTALTSPPHVKITCSSDYCHMKAGAWELYYGYEYTYTINVPDVGFGFTAQREGELVDHFPYEQTGYGMERDLLECIGLWMVRRQVS